MDFVFVCSFDSALKLGIDLWILMVIQNLDLKASTQVRIVRKSLLKVMAFSAGIGMEGWRGVPDPLLSLIPKDLLSLLSELGSGPRHLG